MHRLRAAFDIPTMLGLLGGAVLPIGVGVMFGAGAGLVIFGLECLVAATLSVTTRR